MTADEEKIVPQAALRAAQFMNVADDELGAVLGLPDAEITRLKAGETGISKTAPAFNRAVHFIRLYQELHAITGSDRLCAAWLRAHNNSIEAVPLERMKTPQGLEDVLACVLGYKGPV